MDNVPLDDRGLLLGDGLFETILADHGQFDAFDAHTDRMARGCAALGLPAPDGEQLRAAALAVLDARDLAQARAAVRLTWTAGSGGRGLERPQAPQPRLLAQAAPSALPKGPARLAQVTIRRNAASPTARLKTLAYLDNVMARREAVAAGADEALILNTDGDIAGGAAANLFWITGGRLYTPALACGVLDGIMRGQVLAAAARLGVEAIETRVGIEALSCAEAVFLTNSLIGQRPVVAIDGREILSHPLFDALQQARR